MDRQIDPATRRQFLKGVGVFGALAAGGTAAGVGIWRAAADEPAAREAASPVDQGSAHSLDALADNVVSGGPGKDGIPAIDEPRFIPASRADFLGAEDPVFGLRYRGEVRAYPQKVLVWHEIVNDTIAGDHVSVTYCPLTGSVVAFRGTAGRRPLTFGTTGNLVNSNLLMYDRQTDSEWPQLLGTAIRGRLREERLTEIPLVWSPWGRWRDAHPDTVVLSTDTGFLRSYDRDPYGSYAPASGYYADDPVWFPVLAESDRFDPKEVVVGVKAGPEAGRARLAVRKERVRRARTLQYALGGVPLLAVWDDDLVTARVFVRRVAGRTVSFRNGTLRDSSGSSWDATGRAVRGPLRGEQLPSADFLDAMWFAWYAFYPDTKVIA